MTDFTHRVGVIGLGAMGHGMASSLRRAGHQLHVFDVRRDVAKAFAAQGGQACNSLQELGSACDVVISVVVNAAQTGHPVCRRPHLRRRCQGRQR